MFDVIFYNFSKRSNSTLVPSSSSGTTFSCTIKSGTSILRPTIELKFTKTMMPQYNYCRIPEFNNRYYFIDDIYYDAGIWLFDMRCDVLASFQYEIKHSSQYVIRSSSDYNNVIPDNLYLSKYALGLAHASTEYAGVGAYPYGVNATYADGSTTTITQYFNSPVSSGSFIIGVVGNNMTGTTFYSLGSTDFNTFVQQVLAFTPSNMGDLPQGVARALYDPIQYITYCKWFPFAPGSGTAVSSIHVGPYTVSFTSSSSRIVDITNLLTFKIKIDLPKRSGSVPTYMYSSKWTQYSLYFEPFGLIPLDADKLLGYDSIDVEWTPDFTTGTCNIKVFPHAMPYGLLYYNVCEYGVDIPLTALSVDWSAGAVAAGVTWLRNNASDLVRTARIGVETIAEGVGWDDLAQQVKNTPSVLGAAADAYANAMGQVQTVGAVGSFMAYIKMLPTVYAYFYSQAARDTDRYGAPCYAIKTLTNLSGFCVCQGASFPTWSPPNTDKKPPNQDELEAIIALMNTGIYLE